MEERLSRLEEVLEQPSGAEGEICCALELIGCLDDCVTDISELREKVKDVRYDRGA